MRSRLSRMSNLLVGKHVGDFHFRLTLFIIVICTKFFQEWKENALIIGCID